MAKIPYLNFNRNDCTQLFSVKKIDTKINLYFRIKKIPQASPSILNKDLQRLRDNPVFTSFCDILITVSHFKTIH